MPATLFTGDALHGELAEIDEKLRRNELSVLEQGELLQRRDEVLDELGVRAKRGENRFTNRGAENAPLTTTSAIAHEVGLSERRAQERKQIAKNLAPAVKDKIRGTRFENHFCLLCEF